MILNVINQNKSLELLSPAKNKDVGIAAINCGADALYIAGPSFGARESASNDIREIAALVDYAHKYSAKVYLALNTILYDHEIVSAVDIINQAYNIGVDSIIIQDLGLLKADLPPISLTASTQTNIRTPEQAKLLESLGFKRLILARELSIDQIKSISDVTSCELEFFIHGSLCVSYSGQCYLSEHLTGKSANRGCCTQPCRSLYDLTDAHGNRVVRNKPLLSLRDLCLEDRISELTEAGITSFKIEGRLKSRSYVSNVTRYYREKIDSFIEKNSDRYSRSSFGKSYGGFNPELDHTFNRGYTHLFIDGRREPQWSSGDTTGSLGEYIGKIRSVDGSKSSFYMDNSLLNNGDGIVIIPKGGKSSGMRVDKTDGKIVFVKPSPAIEEGATVYRNYNRLFEKEVENNTPERLLKVYVDIYSQESALCFKAESEDGRVSELCLDGVDSAENLKLAERSLLNGISKRSSEFIFSVREMVLHPFPFLSASKINSIRNSLAEGLRAISIPERVIKPTEVQIDRVSLEGDRADYRRNISNGLSKALFQELGVASIDKAFELDPPENAELMRTKYCIRYELGLCKKLGTQSDSLFLVNGGNRFQLLFDCKACEMILKRDKTQSPKGNTFTE